MLCIGYWSYEPLVYTLHMLKILAWWGINDSTKKRRSRVSHGDAGLPLHVTTTIAKTPKPKKMDQHQHGLLQWDPLIMTGKISFIINWNCGVVMKFFDWKPKVLLAMDPFYSILSASRDHRYWLLMAGIVESTSGVWNRNNIFSFNYIGVGVG